MKWILRIITGVVLAFTALITLLAVIVIGDSVLGAQASDYTNITYPAADGTDIHAYLATPEGDGPFPGVLMVHEWWGINSEITELADRLADEGYVVLAPDTYRGATTQQIPRALYLRLTTPEERVDADMQAAYDYLVNLDDVDADSIGTIGFCYGGGVALRHAVNNPDIDAIVNLYGDTIADPTNFGALQDGDTPLLGIFGAEDAQIPQEEVTAFDDALSDAEIPYTVTVYDGVGHAFVQPDAIDEGGAPAEAWEQILAFFDRTLTRSESN